MAIVAAYPLLSAVVGLTVAGTAISTISQVQAARFNKDVANRDAALAEQQGKIDSDAFRRKARARQGQRIANIAASGVGFEGSPIAILEQSAIQDEFDALLIERGASNRAAGFRAEAGFQKRKAFSAGVGGVFGVGTSILKGIKDR